MGVYVYTMRAKQNSNILFNGELITANLLTFAFKSSFWGNQSTADRVLSRCATFWEEHQLPEYFVVGDMFENGASLYRQPAWRFIWCYDTPKFPGEHLGYLKRNGRKWTVVPTQRECYPQQLIGELYGI